MNEHDGQKSIDEVKKSLKEYCAIENVKILDKEKWVEYSLLNIINSLPQKVNLVKLQMKERLKGDNLIEFTNSEK